MSKKNGFALVLSLMFLLVLTLIALILLLISASYYASARNYSENENVRNACEQAAKLMVDTHNLDSQMPRFFHDPARWQAQQLIPFQWNGYTVNAKLKASWNSYDANSLRVDVTKTRYRAGVDFQLSQIRLEDFALYMNESQSLSQSSLIDGRVFAPNGLNLAVPVVRFRDFVEGVVVPEVNASFRKKTDQVFAYPSFTTLRTSDDFFQQAQSNGLLIHAQNPLFWNGIQYEMNLDLLTISPEPLQRWRIFYNSVDLGVIGSLHFWFDDSVRFRQSYALSPHLSDSKMLVPLHLSSVDSIFIDSSIQPFETPTQRHPIAFSAGKSIFVSSSSPRLVRINAMLIVFGFSNHDGTDASLIVEPSAAIVPSTEVEDWKLEIGRSSFVIEPEKRDSLISVLNNGGKAIWFQGPIAIVSSMLIADDIDEIHFQSSKFQYPFLPSFPFIKMVEGSQQWH